jgi:hypothetical protein
VCCPEQQGECEGDGAVCAPRSGGGGQEEGLGVTNHPSPPHPTPQASVPALVPACM